MRINFSAPWHKVSFDRWIFEKLPGLLAERLPLVRYHAESTGTYTWCAQIVLRSPTGDADLCFDGLAQPDAEGVFEVDGQVFVISPVASPEDLETAEVRCVGERLYDYVAVHLASIPEDAAWDASLAQVLLPLDTWMLAFWEEAALSLETTNWLDRHTRLRRVYMPDRERVVTPGHKGRVCLYEMPEGPNIGRVLSVAQGATIQDGKLEIVKDGPRAALGLTGSMVPFLEHDDGNRLLMGMNMMRQWLEQEEPEPAWVQTGNEPNEPVFWCGRNLLTAFVAWDGYAHEDGVVISESCAKRFRLAHPLAVGDKLSNRHGTKGVVSQILPDREMPHLEDGTPVELIYSLCGVPSRMNFGQVREAVLGRVAQVEGTPVVVPPFEAPEDAVLKKRLKEAGLPEGGMEVLILDGEKLERPSTVGPVYWGCTDHLVRNKIHVSITPEGKCQRQGEMEASALLQAGACEMVREWFHTCATTRKDAGSLAGAVREGTVEPARPPAPAFVDLGQRLGAAGIQMELEDEQVRFGFAVPEGERLEFAQPVSHPWLRAQMLSGVGKVEGATGYDAVAEANERLAKLVKSAAPESLVVRSRERLEACVKEYLQGLLIKLHLRLGGFAGRVLFSGRSVLVPGPDVRTDQLGLPEEICWTLFGPRLAREVGEDHVQKKSKKARQALEEMMGTSWVVLNRAPSLSAVSLIAFHPVLSDGQAIRLHPLACDFLNADFDGDQAAVFLPVTEEAQKEAGEKLSMAGHLTRDSDLVHRVCPGKDDLFGLASLSRSEEGRQKIGRVVAVELDGKMVTKAMVADALRKVLLREGANRALEMADALMRLGFEAAKETGASISPFVGASLNRPPMPEDEDPDAWWAYWEEMCHVLEVQEVFEDPELGAVMLLNRCGARGSLRQLAQLVGPGLGVTDVSGQFVPMRHGWREGLAPEEMFARSYGHLNGLFQMHGQMTQLGLDVRSRWASAGFTVLARARRSENPGVVFARAALSNEVDPLTDVRSRLFVGLSARGGTL